jgi:hypothetical protein
LYDVRKVDESEIREKWKVDLDVRCHVFRGEWGRHRDRADVSGEMDPLEDDGVGNRSELRELSEEKVDI